jgi:HNH endonuclease
MWHWDQGRLEYFEFDVLRRMSQFCVHNDLACASKEELQAAIGLSFDAGPNAPWRNYARIFKSMFIVSSANGLAMPTPVATRLAVAGQVTSDEYFHFVAQATTEPSPALSWYDSKAHFRYPLLFALRYILTKVATSRGSEATFNELIGAYIVSDFRGDESQSDFISLLGRESEFAASGKGNRQPRESLLRTISQVSYLHTDNDKIEATIHRDDAHEAFEELSSIGGPFESDSDEELRRRAAFFKDGSTLSFFEYPQTVLSEVVQAGFREGGRVEKTHLVIERNARLRKEYFEQFDPTICDVCRMDTRKTYPWKNSILDLHHKLPLASGTRIESKGTVISDLVPVCPTCHRAVHHFYGIWLKDSGKLDFDNRSQASEVYDNMKTRFAGHHYAV